MSTKQSTKRNKHRAKRNYDANKESLTWDVLHELSIGIMETLSNYDKLVTSMAKTYPDRLNDFKCKETYMGFYKLLEEHLKQLLNIIKLHAKVDENNELVKDANGLFIYNKGICKSHAEMEKVSMIVLEYMSEQTLVTEIGSKVVPELAVQFQVSKELLDVVNNLSKDIKNTEDQAIKELAKDLKQGE